MSFQQDHPLEYAILCEALGEPTGVGGQGEWPGWGTRDRNGWYDALVHLRLEEWIVADIKGNLYRCSDISVVITTVRNILGRTTRELPHKR